ncbi:MAG: TonB-dependent receptor [Pseudomonadota bacterium]
MLRTSFRPASTRAAITSVSSLALVATLAAVPNAALAQDTDVTVEEDPVFGNQIVVTAQKREETIDDVPITVSALSGDNLVSIGIDEFDEVAAYIPGLIVQEQSPNNPGFVIRGITSDSGSAQIAPRVTIYYNGVDVSRSRGSYFDLFDLERIEVVKGPQATLFGTASTIGAISVVTAKPQPGFEAAASASYGNLDAFEFDGMINFGNDIIAARIAGTYKRRDGYVENIAGEPGTASEQLVGIDQEDLNGVDQWGIRGSLRITPDVDTTIDIVATYEEQNNPGTAFISGTLPPTGGVADPFGPAELGGSPFSGSVLGLDELGLERSVFDISGTFERSFGDNWTLTSITGYREFDSLEVFDADGSALFFLEFSEDAQGEQFSHETRLSYDSDVFRGFFGVNYFEEDGTQGVPFSTDEGTYLACAPFPALAGTQALIAGALGITPDQLCSGPTALTAAGQGTAVLTQGAATILPYESNFVNGGENSSFSVFADATVVLGNFELTAGLRYITEDRRSTFFSDQPLSQLAGFPLLGVAGTNGETFEAEDSFDAWLPRFNVLYRVNEDVNLYATISKGRRSPVLDLDQDGLTLIDGEEVWNFEGGIKLASGPFNASIGAFFQDYTNFQVSLEDEQGIPQPFNAGQAENFGVEVEASYAPSRNLRIFANYAYIDAEIGQPADADASDIFVGSRFRLTPEHSASGGIDASFPIGDGSVELFATPSVTYQSRVFFDQPNSDLISEDGYALVNVRAGVRFGDGRFAVTGFARNLFDEDYLIDGGNTGAVFGTPTFIPGEPALYGIEISARY